MWKISTHNTVNRKKNWKQALKLRLQSRNNRRRTQTHCCPKRMWISMENNYQMFPKPTTKKSNKIQLKHNLFWRFCCYRVTHACRIHGYYSKIKLFWAQICVTPKKDFKKRNPSILWNSFWELSWKSQQDQPKKIIYGELWLLQQMWAYTLIHLIKFCEWIMGYKTRGILKKSNQAITRSLHLLAINFTNVNPDQQKKLYRTHMLWFFNRSFKTAFVNGVNFKLYG